MPQQFHIFTVSMTTDANEVHTTWALQDTIAAKDGLEAIQTCASEGEMEPGGQAVAVPVDAVTTGSLVPSHPLVEVVEVQP